MSTFRIKSVAQMKKLNGRTPPKIDPKDSFFDQFIFTLGLLTFAVGIGGFVLYNQNEKLNFTEKCAELMQYKDNVKLHVDYYLTCSVNNHQFISLRDSDIAYLDSLINYYKLQKYIQ